MQHQANPMLIAGGLFTALVTTAGGAFWVVRDGGSGSFSEPEYGKEIHETGEVFKCGSGEEVTERIDLAEGKFEIVGHFFDFEGDNFRVDTPAGRSELVLAVDADVQGEYLGGDWVGVRGAIPRTGEWVATAVWPPCGDTGGGPQPGESIAAPSSSPGRAPFGRSPSASATGAPSGTVAGATQTPEPTAVDVPAPEPTQHPEETKKPVRTAQPPPPPTEAPTPAPTPAETVRPTRPPSPTEQVTEPPPTATP